MPNAEPVAAEVDADATRPGETAGVRGPLWRDADFVRFWAGLSGSGVGAQFTVLALPLLAITALGASPADLGLVGAARWAPYLLVGPVAGVWLDRVRRRRVIIGSHVGRAALLGLLSVAAWAGWLSIPLLAGVTLALGALMILSDAAYQAMIPGLVPAERLVEANSAVSVAAAAERVVGPSLGGWLIQTVGAPLVLAIDASAFLGNAALLRSLRRPEPPPVPRGARSVPAELAEGVRWVFGSPVLRPIQLASMTFIASNSLWGTVYLLYLTRELGLAPVAVGGIVAVGGPGALAGSLLAGRAIRRFGLGPNVIGGQCGAAAAFLLIPLSTLAPSLAVPLVGASAFLAAGLIAAGSIAELSLRQGITPARLQGRMNATMRSLNWSMAAVGALVGGAVGEWAGISATLWAGALGSVLAGGWLLLSPVGRLRGATAPNSKRGSDQEF